MSSTRARIGVVGGCLAAGFCVVLLHLWFVMVQQHDVWARRSRENRWAFRSVPSQRGAILDRQGRVLAHDEPTMQLSLHYLRFRLRHPVGAAVHGATSWAALQPGREGTRYGYVDGALGPLAAAEHLLAMPARVLRPGVLPKNVAGDLRFVVTTVLSACSGLPRKRVFAALRVAAAADGFIACGDVLPMSRDRLLAAYRQNLDSLRRFDAELASLRRARHVAAGLPPDEVEGLLARLDELRCQSLDQARVRWTTQDEEGNEVEHEGSLVETVRNVFDDYVPFEFAARLRVGAEQHPGLEVHPSIRRIVEPPNRTALNVLIGSVANLDRAQPDPEWVDRFLAREMPPDWLEEFAPEAMAATGAERERLQQEARERYEYALVRRERRGTRGCERAFDDMLMGRLGMRLVEHDSRHREQLLWSHLRVEAGADVRITIDDDLQRIAERLVAGAQARNAALHADPADQKLVEAALAVIDAVSGDVLVYAGAPIVSNSPRDVPGVVWLGNGSLGSVVKPLMLVEQLERQALGLPHKDLASFAPCAGKYVFGNQRFGCGHAHGERGRDPVDAIAESCNSFFFQCAEGFGADGVGHALRRFGLLRPAAADDAFAACWQEDVPGLAVAAPRLETERAVPMRAVGYGVAASPLSVARAYAALATGALPTLSLRAGEVRPRVQLLGIDTELDIVRAGLRGCVDSGTAKNIPLLRHFGVMGKTGTAEVGRNDQNNAWFAGYLPTVGPEGTQLCFCAVVYWVKDQVHGDEAAGELVAQWLAEVEATPALAARYLPPEGGR
ncbi:MAG: hypothetical protein JNM25_20100 [Planctomycetes bacterium]|nr:hypothetical protein [Planctomycetota bacterium]